MEVAGVAAGVDRLARDDEPQPVDRGDLTAAPLDCEWQLGVVIDDQRVRGDRRVRADVVAGDVFQPLQP